MSSLNFLYYALGAGFLVFIIFLSYALWQLGQTFKTLQLTILETRQIIRDAREVERGVRLGIINLLSHILGLKGGEINE
jgi:hypothetical protein